MTHLGDYVIPLVIACILLYAAGKGIDVFSVFVDGAKEGIKTAFSILAPLVALMTAVGMFKASGALDILSYGLRPVADFLHIPTEVMPLALLRPISGSGAMAIFQDLLTSYGPDSYIGRVASVLQGSTETTFYTLAVYFGAVGITKTRHSLSCSLTADVVGFVMSAFAVRMFLGM